VSVDILHTRTSETQQSWSYGDGTLIAANISHGVKVHTEYTPVFIIGEMLYFNITYKHRRKKSTGGGERKHIALEVLANISQQKINSEEVTL